MAADPDPISLAEAPISAVTVFRDGARVARTGAADLPAGLVPVVIGGLPEAADPASVRVALRGRDVALLEVQVQRQYGADPLRDELVRLRADAERCRDQVQALDDEDAAEQARLTFGGHLSTAAAAAMARAVGFGRAGHSDLAAMADYLAAGTAAALEGRRDIRARKRAAERELQAAEQRLAQAEHRAGTAQTLAVTATIEVAAPASAEIEVSYHVSGASWRPLYDLGLAGRRLAVSYLAEVTQRTGEDWPATELVLATARRGLHEGLPELRPWYIGRRLEPPPRRLMAAAMAPGAPFEPGATQITAENEPLRAAAQPAPQAAPLAAEPGESGAGQHYRVPRPVAVPADGSPHKTTIARLDLPAELDYLAVPVLAAEAYVRATVTNDSQLLLLPGPARIFRDNQFAGETALATVAPGEDFELQLGVDEQIRVERKLVRRAASKAVIGGGRTVDIGYETTVQNHRPAQALVTVHDHIPVSSDGEVKVRLREASPSPDEQTDLGELIWTVALEPGQSALIRHRFTVEHPANIQVAGL